MKLKTALSLLIFGTLGYFGYDTFTTHTSGEVMAYKNYAKALLKNDKAAAQKLVVDKTGLKPFDFHEKRMKAFRGGEIRFTYYQVLSQRYSTDRDRVSMRIRQVSRIDPPDVESFFGTEVVKQIHVVDMEKEKSAWKVTRFHDDAYRP
ncbi:MAG: hypothetical protein ACFE0O_12750 [Opitutales bacterium]